MKKGQLWVRPTGGWNSTLHAAWNVTHTHWACMCYVPFAARCLWITSTIWLLTYTYTHCHPMIAARASTSIQHAPPFFPSPQLPPAAQPPWRTPKTLAAKDHRRQVIFFQDACYDRGGSFRLLVFWMEEILLNPRSFGNALSFFFPFLAMTIVVYRGQWLFFHPVSSLFCRQNSFWERSRKLSNWGVVLRKKLVRLYRSSRLHFACYKHSEPKNTSKDSSHPRGRPGGVSGYPRAWYRSVSWVRAPPRA